MLIIEPRADLLRDLAPTRRLRATINVGNPVLAQRQVETGALGGVSAELGPLPRSQPEVMVEALPAVRAAQEGAGQRCH